MSPLRSFAIVATLSSVFAIAPSSGTAQTAGTYFGELLDVLYT